MARRCVWDQLSYPTWEELHIQSASERPDWKLLLLPISGDAESRRCIWRHQNLEPPQDSGALPSSRRRLHHSRRRLVQDRSPCNYSLTLNFILGKLH